MLPDRPGWKTIWLGLASTPPEDGYLYVINEIRKSQTAVFDRRLTIGPADQDSDDFISTLSMGDWSGGGQIDELSGADQSRYWWGIFDGRSPHQAALPPLVFNPATGKPSGATGTSYPLGVVNNTMYYAFGTDIAGYNEAGSSWYTKETMTHAPVGKGVLFNERLFVPCGINGYKIITESGTGNPTVTAAAGATDPDPAVYDIDALTHVNPKPVAFVTAEGDKIFALTTTGGICWSNTGNSDEWEWGWNSGLAIYPKLHSSLTPRGMKVFFNRNGDETIFINHSGGVHLYNRGIEKLHDTNIIIPSYPDMGRAMEVWRAGEDLWVSMGLDIIHYTAANTTIPLAGVNRDAGLPQEYRGAIIDLQAEASALYAIIGGASEIYESIEYSAKTGSSGTGTANFSSPRGITVDSSGNLFVADLNNERLKKYSAALSYTSTVGSSGTGSGQFASNDGAYDVATDASNNVWATDAANHRVQKFTNALVYSAQIDGRDVVNTLNSYDTSFGSPGSGTSQYNVPMGIALDPTTNRYAVADMLNNRVLIKDRTTHAHVSVITSLNEARGVAYDASGNLYVLYVDSGTFIYTLRKYNAAHALQWTVGVAATSAIQAYHIAATTTYVYVTTKTSSGTGSLSLSYHSASTGALAASYIVQAASSTPQSSGIAVAGSLVYLLWYSTSTTRIQTFNALTTGAVVSTIYAQNRSTSSGFIDTPAGISINPVTGNFFISDDANNLISEFNTSGTFVQRFANGSEAGVTQSIIYPDGLTLLFTNYVQNSVVRVIASSIYSGGSASNKFNRPQYLAINKLSNELLVADENNSAIKVWDISSTPAYSDELVLSVGSGTGQISAIGAIGHIAVSQSSGTYYVYIIDTGNNRCLIYSRNATVNSFTYAGQIGSSGSGNGKFLSPSAVTVNGVTGNVFISDASRDDIQEFTSLGLYVSKFSGTGTGDGQLTGPSGLVVSPDGSSVYASDESQHRVTKFTDTIVDDSMSSTPHLQRWTGVGWGGVWEGTPGITPTWMSVVNVTGSYYLTWGADDGLTYRMNLNRYIHNPRQLLTPLSLGEYATNGYIETASADMNMLGFKKIASHVMVFMRHATETERVLVSIDPDDTGWQQLGYVTQPGRTTFPLNPQPPHGRQVIDEAGNTASLGMPFNWIRMKFDLDRGGNIAQTPIIRAVNLHFLKIPQNTATYALDIALPKDTYLGRDGEEISDYLNTLITANEMVLLKHHNKLYRGRLANMTGVDVAGEDFSGVRMINFVEITDEGGS